MDDPFLLFQAVPDYGNELTELALYENQYIGGRSKHQDADPSPNQMESDYERLDPETQINSVYDTLQL